MQNEMRDRLLNLINQDNCPSPFMCSNECKYAHLKNCCGDRLADHLIANGVIVPPCKVGDTVWLIMPLNLQQTEWEIKEGKISMIQQKADKSWKFRVTENHSVQDYTVDKIGKTVFLTKEEAEQKLRKEDEGK
jgi:hypothetical protein